MDLRAHRRREAHLAYLHLKKAGSPELGGRPCHLSRRVSRPCPWFPLVIAANGPSRRRQAAPRSIRGFSLRAGGRARRPLRASSARPATDASYNRRRARRPGAPTVNRGKTTARAGRRARRPLRASSARPATDRRTGCCHTAKERTEEESCKESPRAIDRAGCRPSRPIEFRFQPFTLLLPALVLAASNFAPGRRIGHASPAITPAMCGHLFANTPSRRNHSGDIRRDAHGPRANLTIPRWQSGGNCPIISA
jgi:hypothetical protein